MFAQIEKSGITTDEEGGLRGLYKNYQPTAQAS